MAQRLRVAIAEFATHHPVADEGRIADNEISFGPSGATGIDVFEDRSTSRLIRHFFTRHRVIVHGALIPLRANLTASVTRCLLAIVNQQRVTRLDVMKALDDRLRRHGRGTPCPEVPLQVTDPKDKIGDDGGTRIQFQPE